MSIRAMGVRSALRNAQGSGAAPAGPVVSAIGVTNPPQDAAGGGVAQVKAPPMPEKRSPVSEYLDSVSAWIPSEAVALFLAFAGFFNVFDDTAKEVVLAVVVAAVTMAYAAKASADAHKRRHLQTGVKKRVIGTSFVALLAFLVWWVATPGSFAYDKDELGLDSFWPAIALAVTALGLPFLASWLGVEPLKSKKYP